MTFSRQLVTAPAEAAVTQAELEAHARAAGQPTAQLTGHVAAAQAWVERVTARKLILQTWKEFRDAFPRGDRIELPFGQLSSVTHVKYTDATGYQDTFSSDYWEISTAREPGILALSYGCSWPSTTLRVLDPIEIQFVCGWTTAEDVPADLRAAILMLATHFYENRSAVEIGDSAVVTSKKVEMGVEALIANWRLY